MTDVERLLSPIADVQSDEIQVKRAAAFGQKQSFIPWLRSNDERNEIALIKRTNQDDKNDEPNGLGDAVL
jgi:hypothetical protein